MKKIFFLFLVLLASVVLNLANASVFHFNTLGYLPNEPKVASISKSFESFELINVETNSSAFKGEAKGPYGQEDVKTTVWLADFSSVTSNGTYHLKLNTGETSSNFNIANDVYNFAFKTAMRGFYLWRCGSAVEGDHNNDNFEHEICHMQDGWLDSIGIADQQKDGTGGWHDAGDHGKYIVNAGITVGMMFMAWDQFNEQLNDFDFDLPETASGYPQFLKELKWECDWILKMQYADGSGRVSHKLTRQSFSGFIMPEDDVEKRYFTDWSTAATADFVAMMAQAARYFKPYDKKYAKKCLEAAKISYKFLQDNPEHKRFSQHFRTGGYQSHDADDRIWAAAEMWETTGEKQFLKDFELRLDALEDMVDENWDWGNVKNMGVFTYILSERKGKNPALLENAKTSAIQIANSIVAKSEDDVFNRPFGGKYYWGCNGTIVRQVLNLYVANEIQPNANYKTTSLDAIHHIFGRNVYARSFVTGLGNNPPMNPHDRRSGADNVEAPWPGYLVGGGQNATNWVDEEASYSTNEIAINWQAALVYALAGFVE
ncbi:MAG: glycoside hydrolase family 9 protein [Prolixibacteraceae bacterium]|jgi:endoglucanase|nr:glycoside hydrolase family 9 protein [Prolixibacteraceae bacterium]